MLDLIDTANLMEQVDSIRRIVVPGPVLSSLGQFGLAPLIFRSPVCKSIAHVHYRYRESPRQGARLTGTLRDGGTQSGLKHGSHAVLVMRTRKNADEEGTPVRRLLLRLSLIRRFSGSRG